MNRKRRLGQDCTNFQGRNDKLKLNKENEEQRVDSRTVLKKDEVICPICYSIILEPVTFPCNHNVCRPCFDIHIWETSINCPCCRRRLSVWCRQAVKENSIVNLKLQKEIENQFPLQVAAQKEKELPSEERKLDHVLDEFLAEYSPRPPPRQFAKTGEIAKEFKEILSKHLEDLNQAEESASQAFISKFVPPVEQEMIRNLEENLNLGKGLKENNEECLSLEQVNFIKLRARTVQAPNFKISPHQSTPKKSKQESTGHAHTSTEPSVSSKCPVGINQVGSQGATIHRHRKVIKVARDQFKELDDHFEGVDVYKMLCSLVGDSGEDSNKSQSKKAPIIAKQDGSPAVQVLPRQTQVLRHSFLCPCGPLENADLFKTKPDLGYVHQVLQDHNYCMPAATDVHQVLQEHNYFMPAATDYSMSAEISVTLSESLDHPGSTSSEEKRKLEEQDRQLALQLQKYAETLHNLRQRNRK